MWEPATFGMHKPQTFEEASLEHGSRNIKRAFTYKALNKLIQGSAADMTKKAMVNLKNEGLLPMIQIHDELNISFENIQTMVLGGHGDSMVPMQNHTIVNDKSLSDLVREKKISEDKLKSIIERTKNGGGEIGKLLAKGSAFYAPAASGVQMAESYLKDKKEKLPCAAYLNGEYGVKGLYAGVPVIIGKSGVEKIIELDLNSEEKKNFEVSIKAVRELLESAKKIDPELK